MLFGQGVNFYMLFLTCRSCDQLMTRSKFRQFTGFRTILIIDDNRLSEHVLKSKHSIDQNFRLSSSLSLLYSQQILRRFLDIENNRKENLYLILEIVAKWFREKSISKQNLGEHCPRDRCERIHPQDRAPCSVLGGSQSYGLNKCQNAGCCFDSYNNQCYDSSPGNAQNFYCETIS